MSNNIHDSMDPTNIRNQAATFSATYTAHSQRAIITSNKRRNTWKRSDSSSPHTTPHYSLPSHHQPTNYDLLK